MATRVNRPERSDSDHNGVVSIVLPTFNRASQVGTAIDSVIEQTHERWQLLVVDDGSSDGTASCIEREYGHDPRVRIVEMGTNRGRCAARNAALESSSGEFIAFIDSDDAWEPWKLEAQLAVFRAKPEVGFCWTDMKAVDPEGRELYPRFLRTMYSVYESASDREIFDREAWLTIPVLNAFGHEARARLLYGNIYRWMFIGNITHTPTVVIRRSSLDPKIRFEHIEGVGEDWPFHLKVCRNNIAALLDVPSIRYQVGGADQATRPESNELYARAYVQTIEQEYEDHAALLNWPESKIRETFANGYFWLGSSLTDRCNQEARKWITKSLSRYPHIDTRLFWYLRTWIPSEWTDFLRWMKKRLVQQRL